MTEIIHTPADMGNPTAKAGGRPRIPAWLATLARIVITIVLMGVVLSGVDLPAFLKVLETVDWRWWLSGMGLGIGAQVIAGIRWASLARPVGFSYSVGAFVWRFFEGMFFSLCLPSSIGGDVVKAYRLADSGPRRILAGCTVLADRVTGLAALGVLAGAAVIAAKWSLGPWATLGAGAALLLATLAVFRVGVGSIDRLLALIPAPHPAREFIGHLLPYQARPNLMTHALVWSLLIQVGNAVSVSMIARGLGVTLPMSVWFVVVPMVMLAMVVPISINGVGVREGGMAMLLAPHAVPSEQAVAIALLWFLAGLVSGLIGGLLFLLDSRPLRTPAGGH